MNILICVDDNGGLSFNHRRQSRDRNVIDKVCSISAGRPLWIDSYSEPLFNGFEATLQVDNDFLLKASDDDFCFVENKHLKGVEDRISTIFLFKWNRIYPKDFSFDIPLKEHGWALISSEEFPGNSHETITLEVYRK